MTEKEWKQLFDLIIKMVNLPLPLNEKIKLAKEKAAEYGQEAEDCLDDFNSWLMDG